jgi:predicted O-methyltransferase YrrM
MTSTTQQKPLLLFIKMESIPLQSKSYFTVSLYMTSISLPRYCCLDALKPMVWTAVEYTAKQGDPKSVTDAIWTFAKHYRRIMVIGEEKGGQIDAVLLKHKPKIMYELGCFVGYSAVRFGALLRQWGGKFYSFEIDAQSVEVSRKIVERAGLQDTVEVSVYKKWRGGSKQQ